MNTITTAAILGWPIIGFLIFASQKDKKRGAVLSLLIGFMFLPSAVGIDLPGLPSIDRDNIVALTLIGALLFGGRLKMPVAVGGAFYLLAIFIYLTSPMLTAFTNAEPVIAGPRVIPGMAPFDGLSMIASEGLRLLPLFIGYWLITRVEDQRMMLTLIIGAGLVYSLLLLIEIRLSPQFHRWVYGFHASAFKMTVRGDGFRPSAFLPNGLVAAFFTLTIVVAAMTLWKEERMRFGAGLDRLAIVKPRWFGLAAIYLVLILMLSRSLGALVFGALAVIAIIIFKPRMQLTVAVLITTLAVMYPVLRTLDLVPVDALVNAAASIDEGRAQSLEVRFEQEAVLLARGLEKPLFGWGNWGRFRIYDDLGHDRTLSDGFWVIALSSRGALGYIATYIILSAPIFMVWRHALKNKRYEVSQVTAGICLILSINLLDLVPNAPLTPLTWLFIGVLLRHVKESETLAIQQPGESPLTAAPPRRRTVL